MASERLPKDRDLWGNISEVDQEVQHTQKVKEEINLLMGCIADEITIASCLADNYLAFPIEPHLPTQQEN